MVLGIRQRLIISAICIGTIGPLSQSCLVIRLLAEWSKTHEKKSILADPMFRDAKNGDFRFSSKKNIKKIGFVPFDYSTAGVYGSDEWKARAEMSKDDIERFNQIIISREKECSSYYKK